MTLCTTSHMIKEINIKNMNVSHLSKSKNSKVQHTLHWLSCGDRLVDSNRNADSSAFHRGMSMADLTKPWTH